MRARAGTWLVAALVQAANGTGASAQVPGWFDSGSPRALSQAWRGLSTRRAALFLWAKTTVLGGQLVDAEGRPMPNTALGFEYITTIRGYHADLITDDHGYFVVYGPYVLSIHDGPLDRDPVHAIDDISAYAMPGFPATTSGRAFAIERGVYAACRAKRVAGGEDWAYYVLTTGARVPFDSEEFSRFQKARAAEPPSPWTLFRPQARTGSVTDRVKKTYQLQIVSAAGEPVAGALVRFQAYDQMEGNNQVVETGRDGTCTVEEYQLVHPAFPTAYSLHVDAPGFSVGPVEARFREGETTVIRLQQPARISGTIRRSWGETAGGAMVSVQYVVALGQVADVYLFAGADGTFDYGRIMPGVPFRLVMSGSSLQTTPMPEVESEEMRLKPGEERAVNLTIPMASSLRGIVIDKDGAPVKEKWQVWLTPVHGPLSMVERGMYWLNGAMFVFPNLNQVPFRMRVAAPGFHEYESEEIRLEEGELRFVEVRLH